jgi:hypothetical protein
VYPARSGYSLDPLPAMLLPKPQPHYPGRRQLVICLLTCWNIAPNTLSKSAGLGSPGYNSVWDLGR